MPADEPTGPLEFVVAEADGYCDPVTGLCAPDRSAVEAGQQSQQPVDLVDGVVDVQADPYR